MPNPSNPYGSWFNTNPGSVVAELGNIMYEQQENRVKGEFETIERNNKSQTELIRLQKKLFDATTQTLNLSGPEYDQIFHILTEKGYIEKDFPRILRGTEEFKTLDNAITATIESSKREVSFISQKILHELEKALWLLRSCSSALDHFQHSGDKKIQNQRT